VLRYSNSDKIMTLFGPPDTALNEYLNIRLSSVCNNLTKLKQVKLLLIVIFKLNWSHSMATDIAKKSLFQISFKFDVWKLHLILNSTTFVSPKSTK